MSKVYPRCRPQRSYQQFILVTYYKFSAEDEKYKSFTPPSRRGVLSAEIKNSELPTLPTK